MNVLVFLLSKQKQVCVVASLPSTFKGFKVKYVGVYLVIKLLLLTRLTFNYIHTKNKTFLLTMLKYLINWWKGKPPGSQACVRKKQPRFYWICSSEKIKDATPLSPQAREWNTIFKCQKKNNPWSLRTRNI